MTKKNQMPARSRGRLITVSAMTSIAGLALVGCGGGSDGEYPNGPINYIVPYDPGGGADPMGREFSERLADELGTSETVENVPGGDEAIGITQLSEAEPDGQTLGLGTTGGFLAQPKINSDAAYSGDEDFTPLVRMSNTPYGLFTSPDSDYDSLDDLIEDAKENPGEVSISAPTSMGNPAFAIYMLEDQADIEVNLVTTSGGTAEASLEVMSGRIDAVIGNASGQLGLVESGDLEALAYSGTEDYSEFLPDAVSFEEAGYDIPFISDYMTFAPAGLDEDVESELLDVSEKVASDDGWSDWAADQGALTDVISGDELDEYLEDVDERIEEGIELGEQRSE